MRGWLTTALLLGSAPNPTGTTVSRVLEAIEALRDRDRWRDRVDAATYLGHSGDLRARRPLVTALDDPHYAVRSAALRALVHVRDPRTIPAILQRYGDKEPLVRLEARTALTHFPHSNARPYLIQALDQDPDAAVRLGALEQLAEDEHAQARGAIVDALGEPGPVGRVARLFLAGLPRSQARRWFLDGLDHRDYRVQIACIEALADLDSPQTTAPLIAHFDSRVPEVTSAVEAALSRLKHRIDAQRYFVEARRARGRFEQARALRVLGVLGGEPASRLLLSALDDRDVLVRSAAIAALGTLGETRAINKLRRMRKQEENSRIMTQVKGTLAHLLRLQAERVAGRVSSDEPPSSASHE